VANGKAWAKSLSQLARAQALAEPLRQNPLLRLRELRIRLWLGEVADLADAISACALSLEQAGDLANRTLLICEEGRAWDAQGDLERAETCWQRAEQLARGLGADPIRIDVGLQRGRFQHLRGHLQAALDYWEATGPRQGGTGKKLASCIARHLRKRRRPPARPGWRSPWGCWPWRAATPAKPNRGCVRPRNWRGRKPRGASLCRRGVAGAFFRGRVLHGPAATRSAIRALLPGATVVHFACHAYFDATQPLAAYLGLPSGENWRALEWLDEPGPACRFREARRQAMDACLKALPQQVRELIAADHFEAAAGQAARVAGILSPEAKALGVEAELVQVRKSMAFLAELARQAGK
jgi:tetratricopeptide (TPR) repeat protein